MGLTLDKKTSSQYQSLDGRVFQLGKAPLPPALINCRSTTVPSTRLSAMFSKGATRASVSDSGGGQVDAGLGYYDCLAIQSASFQDAALGTVRGKLFRDGGLTPDKFTAPQLSTNFKPLTLEQMKALEPKMFCNGGGAPMWARARKAIQIAELIAQTAVDARDRIAAGFSSG